MVENRNPLFQVFFNYLNYDTQPVQLADIKVEPMSRPEVESPFDLTLYVREQDNRMQFELVYKVALFESSSMLEMLEQLKYVLLQVVEKPDQLITSYSLVTTTGAAHLPNPCIALYEPPCKPVTQCFMSWAVRAPEQPAIRQGDRTWSYGHMLHYAMSIAQVLHAHGLHRGEVVAVTGSKSFGFYASMLGVLISGGVLLTVDPALPTERQRLMLRLAGAQYLVWVTTREPGHDDVFRAFAWHDIIRVEPHTGDIGDVAHLLPNAIWSLPDIAPDDAAYIFFTSGTTGEPQGILGDHKGLSHFLAWQRETFAVTPQDRCAQLTGLSFDVMLRDVLLPLTSGSCLCIPEGDHADLPQVVQWLERHQISLLHAVPTVAQEWLANVPTPLSLRALRWIFFAGEPLTNTFVHQWREAFPESGKIVNLYGPTETTLAKCYQVLSTTLAPGIQPIGRPLPDTQALVLGENDQLCGIGEIGQIVLRTPFRTKGYLNGLQEIQPRFVKNPFRQDDKDVLFRTGDRGRYRPDGRLDILGRCDHQVKIRGVRVEPDEVSAVLVQHPSVRSCVVVAQQNDHEQSILVAYVVNNQGEVPAKIFELRAYLQARLPSVMMPSAFVFLSSLPTTSNGKVDRRALPLPDQSRSVSEEVYVSPRTPMEKILVGIWKSVLEVEHVGVFDHFFDLGGHSLLAVQVMVRLREAAQAKIPLRALFEHPCMADLAQHVEAIGWAGRGSEAVKHELASCHERGAF